MARRLNKFSARALRKEFRPACGGLAAPDPRAARRGGVLLVWIAYKLLLDTNAESEHHVRPAASFWTAMQTIVIADALMGLDNVLAVAGAAQGSVLLVVFGLLISVPIMIWGSQLILK